jgi:hypothetical protein
MLFLKPDESRIARKLTKNRFAQFLSVLLVLVLGSGAANATQFSVTGNIAAMRSSSLLTGPLLGATTIIQTSPALANGCASVWIGSTDTNTLAAALTAKMTQASVTIWYETADTAPWGDTTSCGVTAIQLN